MDLKDIRTYEQFEAHIKAHLPVGYTLEHPSHDKANTWEDVVLWFVAMQNASLIFNGFSSKDLAQSLISGIKPLDRSDVNQWLEEMWEDVDATPEDENEWLETEIPHLVSLIEGELRVHFGDSWTD